MFRSEEYKDVFTLKARNKGAGGNPEVRGKIDVSKQNDMFSKSKFMGMADLNHSA